MVKLHFISLETWWAGKTELTKVKLDVKGEQNTVFFIFPTIYQEITRNDRGAYYQRGGFVGDFFCWYSFQKNIIYSILGASGSYGIDSTGTYRLEGAGNLVYAGLGYSADFSKICWNRNDKKVVQQLIGNHYKINTTRGILWR